MCKDDFIEPNRHWQEPILLTVPGLGNSGPTHWQTIWEREKPNCIRAELGQWDRPHRNSWVNKLNIAIRDASGPVILVAHSLGCHAVAWWNLLERPVPGGKVRGALLVAPPAIDEAPYDRRLSAFAPLAKAKLPFPSILVASRNDHYASLGQSKALARAWGSRLIDAGWFGHINADSDIGDWSFGWHLAERLIAQSQGGRPPIAASPDIQTSRRSSTFEMEIREK